MQLQQSELKLQEIEKAERMKLQEAELAQRMQRQKSKVTLKRKKIKNEMLSARIKEEQNLAERPRLVEREDHDRERKRNKERDLKTLRLQGELDGELLCQPEREQIVWTQ